MSTQVPAEFALALPRAPLFLEDSLVPRIKQHPVNFASCPLHSKPLPHTVWVQTLEMVLSGVKPC